MLPLFPHEVTDDAELVRIAAGVGDEELAVHTMSLTQRRAEQNPGLLSCRAALTTVVAYGVSPSMTSGMPPSSTRLDHDPSDMPPRSRTWERS